MINICPLRFFDRSPIYEGVFFSFVPEHRLGQCVCFMLLMAEQADVKEKLFGITSRNVKAEGENISAQTHNQIVEIAPPSTTLSVNANAS